MGAALRCAQMKLDVLSAVYFIAQSWRLITPTMIENCAVEWGFLIDHVSSNDDNAVKLTEVEENDWHSLHCFQGLWSLECQLREINI
jgi:hypothetical protein